MGMGQPGGEGWEMQASAREVEGVKIGGKLASALTRFHHVARPRGRHPGARRDPVLSALHEPCGCRAITGGWTPALHSCGTV